MIKKSYFSFIKKTVVNYSKRFYPYKIVKVSNISDPKLSYWPNWWRSQRQKLIMFRINKKPQSDLIENSLKTKPEIQLLFVFCSIVWLGSFRGTELNLSSCVNIQFLPCPSNLRGACSSSGLSWGFRGDRGSCAAFCLSAWSSGEAQPGWHGSEGPWHGSQRGAGQGAEWGIVPGSQQKECSSPDWQLGQQRPRAVCSPTALTRDPLLWTGAETTSHTTNLGYFRHWDTVLQVQAVINYWLFEIYNNCFFHRTEIWWWLQSAAPVRLSNCCLKKRPQMDPYFKVYQTQNWQLLCQIWSQTLLTKTESITTDWSTKKLCKGRMWN